jgi:hypothetical protein
MRIFKKIAFILLVFFVFYVLIINTFLINNAASHMLMCKNTLKMIYNASIQYRARFKGQWASSLIDLEPYYEGKYKPEPNRIPKCPGDRNLQETSVSSEYIYFPPKIEDNVPVCWDGKPHQIRGFFFSDTLLWNVLYSDGHIKRLNKDELIQELSRLAKMNPDVLKVLNLLNIKNNEN